MADTFPETFVAGVVNHINEDHRAEMLDLARGLAGCSWAEEAEILHTDQRGIDLRCVAPGVRNECACPSIRRSKSRTSSSRRLSR